MPYISLDKVSLKYPIYDSASRSFRRSLTRAIPVGGKILREKGEISFIQALDRVSFTLTKGDRVALLGHNGAGKTSMLKLLAGFYEPSSGRIDRSGKTSALLDLMSGMDINLNGFENIILCGMLYGLSRKEAKARVDDIAEFSELGQYLDMPIRLYSSGMLLRLAFSICTSIDSQILLLDEWVGAGDESFIEKTQERLANFVMRSAILVFATHNPTVARQLCTKAIYLEHGKMKAFDDIEIVLEKYFSGTTQVAS
ncbi:MAG: ABC transporter ATP-binding protein [Pseudomonadota bacterium]